MGVARQGLRLLRLVLLGGALSVLWLLLTAASSSAAPGQGERPQPVLGEAAAARDVLGAARADVAAAEAAVSAAPTTPPRPQPEADATVVEPIAEPVLSATEDVTHGLLVETHPTVEEAVEEADEVVAVVEAVVPEVVVPELPQPDDVVAPPAQAPDSTSDQAAQDTRAHPASPGPARDATGAGHAAAPTEVAPATAAAPWLVLGQETSRTGATTTQQAARGSDPSSLPYAPRPAVPASSGCVPGAAAGGGGQLDQVADRTGVFAEARATSATCAAGHGSSVPGPSVLPGFSPE